MKSTLLVVLGLLFSPIASADSLPAGKYGGRGLWKTTEKTGTYEVVTIVAEKSIETTYSLPNGETKVWKFDMTQSANGFFVVEVGGEVVGQGYCIERSPSCHYEIQVGPMKLEETLTVQQGQMYRMGSKTEGGKQIAFQEISVQVME